MRLGRELWPQVEFVGGGVGGFLVGRQQPGQKALDPADGLGLSVDSQLHRSRSRSVLELGSCRFVHTPSLSRCLLGVV